MEWSVSPVNSVTFCLMYFEVPAVRVCGCSVFLMSCCCVFPRLVHSGDATVLFVFCLSRPSEVRAWFPSVPRPLFAALWLTLLRGSGALELTARPPCSLSSPAELRPCHAAGHWPPRRPFNLLILRVHVEDLCLR